MQDETPNLPVPVEEGTQQPQRKGSDDYLPIVEGPGSRMFCSLPSSTPRERAWIARTMTADAIPLVDCGNMTLVITDAIVTTIEVTDKQTGEVLTLPAVRLLAKDGKIYSFSGKVPSSSLTTIVNCMGKPPWPEGLPLLIKPWSNGPDRKSVEIQLDFDTFCGNAIDGKAKVKGK